MSKKPASELPKAMSKLGLSSKTPATGKATNAAPKLKAGTMLTDRDDKKDDKKTSPKVGTMLSNRDDQKEAPKPPKVGTMLGNRDDPQKEAPKAAPKAASMAPPKPSPPPSAPKPSPKAASMAPKAAAAKPGTKLERDFAKTMIAFKAGTKLGDRDVKPKSLMPPTRVTSTLPVSGPSIFKPGDKDADMALKQARRESMKDPKEIEAQDAWAQKILAKIGPCPQGKTYTRAKDGYVCQGQGHAILDAWMSDGHFAIFSVDDQDWDGKMWAGPYVRRPGSDMVFDKGETFVKPGTRDQMPVPEWATRVGGAPGWTGEAE